MELKLKGIPAIIAVVVIVAGLIGYRFFFSLTYQRVLNYANNSRLT